MVIVDYSRDSLLSNFGVETLKDRYLLPEEKSPQEAFARAAKAYADDDNHAQRIYDYASKLYFSFSTPILSNAGTKRGLPISCYLSHISDSRQGIVDHWEENMFLASTGGGIGSSWSNIRSTGVSTSKGSRSNGIIPFLKVVDSEIQAVSQGSTRRGSYAAYLNISHPEIEEFILMRKATGGDENRKCLNLHHAVNLTDEFMNAVKEGKEWELIDPHTKVVVKKVQARDLWQSLLEVRVATGEPYFCFIDMVNKLRPEGYPEIETSNLCQEVLLHTSEEKTAVCCLSSVNLEYFDEWSSDPLFIGDIVRYLDNVLAAFILEAPQPLWRAVKSALEERSIGLGAMGFHSYLQKKGIPFEGPLAKGINNTVFSYIKAAADKESIRLGYERGIPKLSNSRRNAHLMAIAPNASSSIICGNTSPSIEPFRANAIVQKTLSGSNLLKNKHLEQVLEIYGKNNEETWISIINQDGSVQHLDFLTKWEKSIFKTAIELDQYWIIEHAADRQKYICQGQSVNLFFLPTVNVKYLHDIHWKAWEKGLKGLYYLRSASIKNSDKISERIERQIRQEEPVCYGCEG